MKKKHQETLILGVVVLLVLTGSLFTAQDTERDIESNARKSYVFKNFLKDANIQVQSQNGTVTLTGTVTDDFHKTMAGDILRDMPGVKSVDNQLQVIGPTPKKYSDEWYKSRITSMLQMHGNYDPENTQVEVKDGRVTISGEAITKELKDTTTGYVKDLEGLREVRNEMTVSEAPKIKIKKKQATTETIDDASIEAMANMALFFHHAESPFKINITVKNGAMILTGEAKSATERDWIASRLQDIKGVRRIDNRITVENEL